MPFGVWCLMTSQNELQITQAKLNVYMQYHRLGTMPSDYLCREYILPYQDMTGTITRDSQQGQRYIGDYWLSTTMINGNVVPGNVEKAGLGHLEQKGTIN